MRLMFSGSTISTMATSQKALFLDKKFGKFTIKDTEIYKPNSNDVLIKIQATSLNPIDWKIQKFGVYLDTYPIILGTDISGDVIEIGDGVTEFKKGDRVFCHGRFSNQRSSYQQYTLAAGSTIAKIPANVTYDQAAALPVALSCAYVGLYNKNPYGLGINPPITPSSQGKYGRLPFFVFGGSTSVGQMVIQLAKLSGFCPILTTASLKNAEYLESLGATSVIDRNLPSIGILAEIQKITDIPIHYIFDAVGTSKTQEEGFDILSFGGQMATVLPTTLKAPIGNSLMVVQGVWLPQNIELLETLYHDKILGFLEGGIIKANNIEVLSDGLAGIPEGLARMEANEISATKLIVHPQQLRRTLN